MARISITHYLIRCERDHGLDPELRRLLETVARACKTISHAVGQGVLGDVLGSMGTTNVQGETQAKLDVLANSILVEANEWGGYLVAMASEEMDHAYGIPVKYPRGRFDQQPPLAVLEHVRNDHEPAHVEQRGRTITTVTNHQGSPSRAALDSSKSGEAPGLIRGPTNLDRSRHAPNVHREEPDIHTAFRSCS
jgi:hypothetical protein